LNFEPVDTTCCNMPDMPGKRYPTGNHRAGV
jgi:hypothetical protein